MTLIPDPPRRQNLLLYKKWSSPPDGTGTFVFRGIAPGTYKIFAWENLPELAEQNAVFMSDYESRGITVTVSAGLALTVMKVPLIHTH